MIYLGEDTEAFQTTAFAFENVSFLLSYDVISLS